MKDFYKAVLTFDVEPGMGDVYKKAIEAENSPWGLRDHWNGNHAAVTVISDGTRFPCDSLIINLISHTLPNLKSQVDWYEEMGCKVISTKYEKGGKQ
ncbi:MAG: hypothetical protein ACLTXM_16190 [Enterococcus sp.]